MVRRSIGDGRAELKPSPLQPDDAPESKRKPLYPVHSDEIADRAGGQPVGGQPAERSGTGKPFDFGPKRLHVLPIDRLGDVRYGLLQRLGPSGVGFTGLKQATDCRTLKESRRDVEVQVVVADLPAATDDATCGKVEPGYPPADLDLLAAWQPVAVLVERALENDADVLQLAIEIRCGGETEAKPDQLGRSDVDVENADHQRTTEGAGPNLHLIDCDLAVGSANGQRIGESVVVRRQAFGRQRVDRVTHLVTLADPDEVAEVVGDDAEVVAMVVDVGGQEGAVAPAQDDLLATVGGPPIHFHVELVRLDQPGRLGQSLSNLGQEENESVGPCPVAREPRISLKSQPPIHRSSHQRERPRRVPGLGDERGNSER